ncbi:MAG: GntR family transcriptional regulator [Pseudomonadota bacterium]
MTEAARIPAAEVAYRTIRADIVSGALTPGARLTEAALAESLGLSRTPVREAMGRLIHEGFVERNSGYDTRVARFPADEIEEIFQIRRRLECLSARRAAANATAAQIAALREGAALMTSLTPPKSDADYQRISEANEAFHRTIVEAAKAPRLTALLAMAVDVGLVAQTYRMFSAEDLIRSARHHEELAAAIAAGDEDWAESVMSAHILNARNAARAAEGAR